MKPNQKTNPKFKLLSPALHLIDLLTKASCLPGEIPEKQESLAEHPFIAGGAARDLLLDKPIKDVDVFWPIHKNWLMEAVIRTVKVLNKEGVDYRSNNLDKDYMTGYMRKELLGVLTIPEWNVDLIYFDSDYGRWEKQVVSTFDTSICQAWVSGSLEKGINVQTTDDFDVSVEKKEIWTYPNIQTRHGHIERMIHKFPDYKLIIRDSELAKQLIDLQVTGFVYEAAA